MIQLEADVQAALNGTDPLVLDLFAGPGGWSEACKALGLTEIGVEFEKNACKTRRAAGHLTIEGSVTDLDLAPWKGRVVGLIASPPCQAFSVAGRKAGTTDPRGQLVTEVMRYVRALDPEWVACEQVMPVLPIWKDYAAELQALGYHTWVGNLNSADYGVPQTRKRAILIASKTRPVAKPAPTHDVDGANGLPRWITLGDALSWTRPSEPAETAWVWERPSTTVVASFSPETIAGPGYRKAGDGPRQNAPGSVKVTQSEAGVLQSFRPDYPWQGAKTRQRQQVGNAIPVLLAQAALLATIPLTEETQ